MWTRAPLNAGRSALVVLAALALVGCQTAAVVSDYDPNRDFTHYRDWRWADPAVSFAPAGDPRIESDLTTQRVRDAVSGQLDVRGLRPAVDPAEADLQVKVYVISELRKDNVTTSYGGFFGGYWGGGWGGGPGFSETRSVDYQVLTLQIDLLDGRDGQLVWRGSDEQQLRSTPMTPVQRSELIQTLATRILGGFPP